MFFSYKKLGLTGFFLLPLSVAVADTATTTYQLGAAHELLSIASDETTVIPFLLEKNQTAFSYKDANASLNHKSDKTLIWADSDHGVNSVMLDVGTITSTAANNNFLIINRGRGTSITIHTANKLALEGSSKPQIGENNKGNGILALTGTNSHINLHSDGIISLSTTESPVPLHSSIAESFNVINGALSVTAQQLILTGNIFNGLLTKDNPSHGRAPCITVQPL